ncbi:MAG TPA: hypothetical protein PLK69_01110, partial [Tetrasphaera sp.]|nr:hypothetical protein [Tetrasphaera sp.]
MSLECRRNRAPEIGDDLGTRQVGQSRPLDEQLAAPDPAAEDHDPPLEQAVIDELLWDAAHADSEEVAEELTNTAEDVNLWGETDTVTEHSVT